MDVQGIAWFCTINTTYIAERVEYLNICSRRYPVLYSEHYKPITGITVQGTAWYCTVNTKHESQNM